MLCVIIDQKCQCLFIERNSKICNELRSNDQFMRADPTKAEKRCLIGWIGRDIYLVTQKRAGLILIFCILPNYLHLDIYEIRYV